MFHRLQISTVDNLRITTVDSPLDGDIYMVSLNSYLLLSQRCGLFRLKSGFAASGLLDDGTFVIESTTHEDWYWKKVKKNVRTSYHSPIVTLADQGTVTVTHADDTAGTRIVDAFKVIIANYISTVDTSNIVTDIDISSKDRDIPFDYSDHDLTGRIKLSKTYTIVDDLVAIPLPPDETLGEDHIISGDNFLYILTDSGGTGKYAKYSMGSGTITYEDFLIDNTNGFTMFGSDMGGRPRGFLGLYYDPECENSYKFLSYDIQSDGSSTERDLLGGKDAGYYPADDMYYDITGSIVGIFSPGALTASNTFITPISAAAQGRWCWFATVGIGVNAFEPQGNGWSSETIIYDGSSKPVYTLSKFAKECVVCYGFIIDSNRNTTVIPSAFTYSLRSFLHTQPDGDKAIITTARWPSSSDYYALTRYSCDYCQLTVDIYGYVTNVNILNSGYAPNVLYNRENYTTHPRKRYTDFSNNIAIHGNDVLVLNDTSKHVMHVATFEDLDQSLVGHGIDLKGHSIGNEKLIFFDNAGGHKFIGHLDTIEEYFTTGLLLSGSVTNAAVVNSIVCTVVETTNSSVKFAVSANGLYYKWSGVAWVTITDLTTGNTKTELEGSNLSLLLTEVGDTFTYAVVLISDTGVETPEFHSITTDYDKGAEFEMASAFTAGEVARSVEITKSSATTTQFKNITGADMTIQGRVHLE